MCQLNRLQQRPLYGARQRLSASQSTRLSTRRILWAERESFRLSFRPADHRLSKEELRGARIVFGWATSTEVPYQANLQRFSMGKPGNLQDSVLDGWVPSAGTVNAFPGGEDAVKESSPLHAAHAIWNCAALGG